MPPWLLLVIALGACGRLGIGTLGSDAPGPQCQAVESCNGIDDDCDGLVDEGCTCAPFDQTLPMSLDSVIVSLGVGYGLQSNTTSYLRIDDTGAIVDQATLQYGEGGVAQTLAWSGTELAYYDANQVGFGAADGTAQHAGPSLGGTSIGQGQIRWNGAGYDVADSPFVGPMQVVRTDPSGSPLATSLDPTPSSVVYLLQLMRGAVMWAVRDPSDDVTSAYVAMLSPAGPLVPISIGPAQLVAGGAATDGTRILAAWNGTVTAVDGTATAPVAFGTTDPALGVAWTGAEWEVMTQTSGNPAVVTRIRLDRSLAVIATDTVITVPHTTGFGWVTPVVIADARRTTIAWSYSVDSAPGGGRVVQLCP